MKHSKRGSRKNNSNRRRNRRQNHGNRDGYDGPSKGNGAVVLLPWAMSVVTLTSIRAPAGDNPFALLAFMLAILVIWNTLRSG